MESLPTGTLTFLFTDVEGSTVLWESEPAAMRGAMSRHDELIEQCVTAEGGLLVRPRGEGDSRFAVFRRASDALSAAGEIQRALAAEPWPLSRPLRVRMAVHTGEADLREGDYYGSEVNRCARLRSLAHGGQVLVSEATHDLARDSLPAELSLLDLGEHRLKDLQRPERVYQLVIAHLPSDFPPLQSLDSLPNNLPIQLTSFVGRDRELRDVEEMMQTARLLTLTGPGGTGKTRLSLQAAADRLERFPDGVWLVELAPQSDPALVPQTVAAALGLPPQGSRPVGELLADFLRSKDLLLLLDNCEHLIEACADLANRLLRLAPKVKIMATSREPLGIAGETIYRVPSLDLPQAGATDLAQLSICGAIRLFQERAGAVKPGFALTESNASAVAKICQRLDGIPLAIELAAARVKALSPEQIATRLDDRFRLLTGGSRTALPRQQTLRALIDWSHDLLSEPERVVLRRLSVFVGSWSLEAAEEVTGDEGRVTGEGETRPVTRNPGQGDSEMGGRGEADTNSSRPPISESPYLRVPSEDVLDILTHLVDRSLVIADESDDGETRYRFLETIRQYARDKLLESGEAEEIRDRHVRYYLNLTARLSSDLVGRTAPAARARLGVEDANILSAVGWAAARDPEAALEIGGHLLFYRGQASFIIGMSSAMETAVEALDALPAAPEVEPRRKRSLAYGLTELGQNRLGQGETALARAAFERAAALARELGDNHLLAHVSAMVIVAYAFLDNLSEMEPTFREGFAAAQASGSAIELAILHGTYGRYWLWSMHDTPRAQAEIEESIRCARSIGDDFAEAMSQIALAGIKVQLRDYAGAAELYEVARTAMRRAGDPIFENIALSGLTDVARLGGDFVRARQMYAQTIRAHRQMGNRGGIARCFECLAFIEIEEAEQASGEHREERARRAARLLGFAESLRNESQANMNPEEKVEYDGYLARLRALLDDKTLERAREEGRHLTTDEATAGL